MKLRKSSSDRLLAGVCGGIAENFGINSLWIRLLFVFGGAIFFWVYLALWLILPN